MSNFNGRHGPNVSQYLRELDTISPESADDTFAMEADLALFTNTQFFDFDSGQNTDFQAQPAKPEAEASTSPSGNVSTAASVIGEMPNIDFMSNDFSFPEFNANNYNGPQMNNFPEAGHGYAAIQPQMPAQFQTPAVLPTEKHQGDVGYDGEPRGVGAEEDKRRRNTAASARFRIKKKQREQALEQSAKEMSDKVSNLESKVSQLETENKWLKNLLVEKNEGNEDISALWKEFTKQAGGKLKASGSKKD